MDIRLEFRRQIAHMLMGLAVVYLFLFTQLDPIWLLGLALLSELLFLINRKLRLPFVNWLVNVFERGEDKKSFPGRGFFTYLVGCTIVLLVFERDIAFAAIMVLAFGDSISTLVGKFIGVIHFSLLNTRKTLEGSFAGWLVAFNLALFFVTPLEALVASGVGMIVEIIEIRFRWAKLEDNITVPVMAGLGVFALRLLTKV